MHIAQTILECGHLTSQYRPSYGLTRDGDRILTAGRATDDDKKARSARTECGRYTIRLQELLQLQLRARQQSCNAFL